MADLANFHDIVDFQKVKLFATTLQAELTDLDAATPSAPIEITDDVDALIYSAARDVEQAISHPFYPDSLKVREMVRGMIERITISRYESGAIEVRGAFAGVMQAAGLVERHPIDAAFRTKKPSSLAA